MDWTKFSHVGKPISMLQARLALAKFRNAYPALTAFHKKIRQEQETNKQPSSEEKH